MDTTHTANGATTGSCPYGLPLRCTITRRGGPLCPPNRERHPHSQRGNHRGLPLRFAIALIITRRGGPLCPPNHERHPHRHPTRGNHGGLPLRFAMNHHPSGRTPVSAQPRTPPTQPMGQPQGVAPTVCYCVEPSPVGADPCVHPTANATHAANGATTGVAPTVCHEPSPVGADPRVRPFTNPTHAATGATTGGCPYGLPLPQPHARNPAGVAVARRTAPPYPR